MSNNYNIEHKIWRDSSVGNVVEVIVSRSSKFIKDDSNHSNKKVDMLCQTGKSSREMQNNV